jgi:shikimate dehydrogenase
MLVKFAVMGSPISHSLSPTLHEAAFGFLAIEASYEKVEKSKLTAIDLDSYAGLSLTMPLKLDAFELADSHDDESKLTGVSNTLLISNSRVTALNTDVYGILASVDSLEIKSVQIIGTGATAKSAAVAMRDKNLSFSGRNPEKLLAIENWAKQRNISVAELDRVDLVIDTTPENAESGYLPHDYVLDVAYSSARNSGNPKLISGYEMLLHQAVAQSTAFSSLLGKPNIDLEELTAIMRKALVGRVGEWSNA